MVVPDVLLLDEWIGTGDATFREKMKAQMDSVVARSNGLVIATHNVELMKSLCNKGLVLQKGRVAHQGDIEDSLDFYRELRKSASS
jgi:lipopolysaccharide transport system ATP-binding protein